jgi:cytochrome b561
MLRNSQTAWGWPAKTLHLLGAAAIFVLLVHGWWMTHMLPRPERLANYAWHSAIGYDLLALTLLRLVWRWVNIVPALPVDSKPWERIAAHSGHTALYLMILVVSLTGWTVAATLRTPAVSDLFGISLPTPAWVTGMERSTRAVIEETHEVLAYILAAIVLIHIGGALRHHVVKKNDVLRRMF